MEIEEAPPAYDLVVKNDHNYDGMNMAVLEDQKQKGILNSQEYLEAKHELMHGERKFSPSDAEHIPMDAKLISIHPDLKKRVIIELANDSLDAQQWKQAIPFDIPKKLEKKLSKQEWTAIMQHLSSIPDVACLFPCQWVWIFLLILFFVILLRLGIWLFFCLLPLGWILDMAQYLLRYFLCKWNRELKEKNIYLKFQTIKRDFHEKHYLSIAFEPDEIRKLKQEPIFQRGQDIYHQERGDARCCPIDSHRVL